MLALEYERQHPKAAILTARWGILSRTKGKLAPKLPGHHGRMEACPFCPPVIESQIILSDAHCYAIWTQETPEGSAMVLPRAHRPTVFDLTDAEWVSTRRLLEELRPLVTRRHDPDGWNVGWNVEPVGGQSIPHAHCHLVPRYVDEPHAGRGIRAWLKDPGNRPPRHGPARPPSWRSIP